MFLQKTIRSKVVVEGIGLHTGKPASLAFCPAPPSTGIHFVRRDLPGTPSVRVTADRVQATQMATTLGCEQFSVSTVEHCLSALAALRIDNLVIELQGPEIPIVDGSALPYLEALQKVGYAEQEMPRQYLYVTEPVEFQDGEKSVRVAPYNGLRISCSIDFSHPAIGFQKLEIDINESSFSREIAPARTFGFLKDVTLLQAKGLALGGSLKNAIVLDEERILNPEGLRFSDEFVRHKVLDALGDLVTLGAPLMGHILLHRAGHDVMNRFARHLLSQTNCYRMLELGAAWDGDIQSLSRVHAGGWVSE